MAAVGETVEEIQAAYNRLKKNLSKTNLAVLLDSSPEWFRIFEDRKTWETRPFLHPALFAAVVKFACRYARREEPRRLKINHYDMARLVNPYKDFWCLAEDISSYESDSALLGTFLIRFVYQQIHFLHNPDWDAELIAQTRNIYCDRPTGTSPLDASCGFSSLAISEFLEIGSQIYHYFKSGASSLPLSDFFAKFRFLPEEKLRGFLALVSATPNELVLYHDQTKAADLHQVPYEINPVLKYPLIRHQGKLFCPIPHLLLYAITKGIYFYLLDMHGGAFAQQFGGLFERYIGRLMRGYFSMTADVFDETEERARGWVGKNNDFSILGGPRRSLALLVECKASLLYLRSKQTAALSVLRQDIGKNLKHAYEQLASKWSALNPSVSVPHPLGLSYQNVKPEFLYPVVLTYDPLMWANSAETLGNIFQESVGGAPLFRPQLWNIDEFERLLQLARPEEFFSTITQKFTVSHAAKDLDVFLRDRDSKGSYKNWNSLIFIPSGENKAIQALRVLAASSPENEFTTKTK